MYAVDEFTHEGIAVAIYAMDDASNPYTEWDNASRLLIGPALAREYRLGQDGSRPGDAVSHTPGAIDDSPGDVGARYLTLMEGCAVAIPFRVVDYGSGGMRAYLDPGDDASGYVVVDRETVAREWPETTTIDGETFSALQMAERCARAEFGTFAAYVAGEVYGYVVADGTPEYDSVWGFYGDGDSADGAQPGETDAHGPAREAAEYAAEARRERIRRERMYLLDPLAIDRDAYYAREGVTS